MNTPIIEVRNLSKTFVLHQQGGVAIEALSGISFSVDAGECVALHGPSGAGKSTLLRLLTGELDSTNGSVTIDPTKRVSVLKQNQNAYDAYTVMDTVIMGNQHLYDVMKEKDAIYEKPDFSDDDGLRAALCGGPGRRRRDADQRGRGQKLGRQIGLFGAGRRARREAGRKNHREKPRLHHIRPFRDKSLSSDNMAD